MKTASFKMAFISDLMELANSSKVVVNGDYATEEQLSVAIEDLLQTFKAVKIEEPQINLL